jgi:hypothetical protein
MKKVLLLLLLLPLGLMAQNNMERRNGIRLGSVLSYKGLINAEVKFERWLSSKSNIGFSVNNNFSSGYNFGVRAGYAYSVLNTSRFHLTVGGDLSYQQNKQRLDFELPIELRYSFSNYQLSLGIAPVLTTILKNNDAYSSKTYFPDNIRIGIIYKY